jgi:methylated-DNA-[protein]-cysteine S-methyltransferase
MASPIGKLTLIANEDALVAVIFPTENNPRDEFDTVAMTDRNRHPVLLETKKQLQEYFVGERREFDLLLRPHGTDFQMRVWAGLRDIPYGQLWSYGQLAAHIGQAGAARAVGAANGRNPIPIIVPCHRVIGSSGKLVGFGGGLDTKAALIELEERFKA